MTHELKIDPIYYNLVSSGVKNFEIRKNDRNFKIGDTVILKEFEDGEYTGSLLVRRISYIFFGGEFGLDEEYCIFSFMNY